MRRLSPLSICKYPQKRDSLYVIFDGKLKSVKDYRGILTGEEGHILKEYGYDSFERTNSITIKDSSNLNSVKESYGYTYDKNNNILTERIINSYPGLTAEKTDELRSHTYDCNGRLVKTVVSYSNNSSKSPVTYTYSYDAVGNRTSETESGSGTTKSTEYVYNSLNQLVNSTETTGGTVTAEKEYLYDKTGNQIQETDSKTSEVRELSYDVAGNMTRLVKKKKGVIELTQENQYNGNGQRICKTEADDVTRYFYQSDSVLYTADEADHLTSWNLLGSSGNAIGTTRGTGTAEKYYLYTKDIRESTSNIVDDSGAGVVSYQYNDFGETEAFGNQSFFNEICYTGGIQDASTGIYYLNARYYDPASGVFLSQDSYRGELNDPASLNLYGYCQGNPITYTDPTGHFPWVVAAVWAYRGYKAYKAVKTTAKVVKVVRKTAKVVRVVKTVSKAKKAYKVVKPAKKLVRAVKKVKSTKNIKKLHRKSSTKRKGNIVTKKLKQRTTYKKKDHKPIKRLQKRKNPGCFVAGTKVSTKNGFVPIEQIKVGDRVWAEDTSTGKKALKKVKKIFVREKDSLIRLSVNGQIIETTDEHPFWIKDQGWIPAGSLNAGDIVKLQTGEYVPIETYEVVLLKEPIKVYNFHVEDYECYYVSEQKVLVHNNNVCGEEIKKKGKSFRGGKKSQRDNWYGYNDKNFQRWWHRVGKKEFGGNDIEDSRMAKEAFEEWVERGRPKVR